MKKIPSVLDTYDESDGKVQRKEMTQQYEYEFVKGEVVLVYKWVRFPSYDFIFGVPHPDSPRYKEEFGFFAFRKKKADGSVSVWAIYIDQAELEEMKDGFMALMRVSNEQRVDEWVEHYSKKGK